ncbi:hypothetical protein F5Y14DRAFT_412443 [Nemania sp. NC0429]|nr:hypothetical protein F5Y14DRAFT_412443 [Nemania sp. NC0429]
MIDDNELWMNEDEEECTRPSDPTFFKLDLTYQGEHGGFLTRNQPGQKQRQTVTSRGNERSSRFYVSCIAKAIIHGTLDTNTWTPATLLVYDFEFSPLRSGTRIKEVVIIFQFSPKANGTKTGPKVISIQPSGTHTMLETTESTSRKLRGEFTANFSNAGFNVGPTVGGEWNSSTVRRYATAVIGATPADDWGHRYQARWSLFENESQHSGVPTLLRSAILLERGRQEGDGEFICVPTIEVKVDFKTTVLTLFSTNSPDDPIEFSNEYEPFNELEIDEINPQNLASVSQMKLWDCTFHRSFTSEGAGGREEDEDEQAQESTIGVELNTAD